MVTKKGGSEMITCSGKQIPSLSEKELSQIMEGSHSAEKALSVDSAMEKNEGAVRLGESQSGGKPKKKTRKAEKVGSKIGTAKKKKKATSKTAKSVGKRSESVKVRTKEGVGDMVEIVQVSNMDVDTLLPGRKTSRTGGGKGRNPEILVAMETQAVMLKFCCPLRTDISFRPPHA
eukprot:snap_masked-scaffold_27-processed-gene-4.20-mRNA-1 protein AED:1.00 eAED:1.00 QI:0/0/0/0/1/1/2/0/174